MYCPNSKCNKPLFIKYKDIINSNTEALKCPYCGVNTYIDAMDTMTSIDHGIEVRKGLNYLSGKTQKLVKYDSGIARTAEPLYRGTDGIDYYNCRCIIHNQSCILSENELVDNHHKFCNNIYNIFVDEINIKNLKLNHEASITEREENKNN